MSSDDLTKLLGIRFERDGEGRFIAWSNLPAQISGETAHPARWQMIAIAHACAQYGAEKLSQPGKTTQMGASSSRFFSDGKGTRLMAVAEVLYRDAQKSSWRTSLYRLGDKERQTADKLVAEFNSDFVEIDLPVDSVQLAKAPKVVSEKASLTPFAETQTETVADRRRQQIFVGACEVIARKGFAAASMREIAKAASITIPTMYKYIETKKTSCL